MSEFVSGIQIINTIVETVTILNLVSSGSLFSGGGLCITVVIFLLVITTGSSCGLSNVGVNNASHLTELCVAHLAVGVVVAPSQDGLHIFTSREEAVSLEVRDQVWHVDAVVSSGDSVEGAGFDEVWAVGELALRVTSRALEEHLLVEQSREERKHLVGQGLGFAEVRGVASRASDVAQVRVR